MKKTTLMAALIGLLLILSGASWLPSVLGQGSDQALPARVTVLEELVAVLSARAQDLSERVEALEAGQGTGTVSFDMIHFNVLQEFPPNPTEGSVCVVLDQCNDDAMNNFVCYLDGQWMGLWHCNPIIR